MLQTIVEAAVLYALSWVLWKAVRNYFVKSALDNIPGPSPNSFWKGSFPQIFNTNGWDFHREIAEKYGRIVKIKALLGESQFFNHLDTIKDQYIYEETTSFIRGNQLIFGHGLLGTLGEQHRKQRKMLNPVFSITHMREMTPTFYGVIQKLHHRFEDKVKDGPVELDVLAWMSRAALELIGQSGLGHSFDSLEQDIPTDPYGASIKALVPANFKIIFPRSYLLSVVDKIGTPKFRRFVMNLLPWKTLHDIRDIADLLHHTSVKILESKRKALEEGDEAVTAQIGAGKDIMSILIKANTEAAPEDSLTEEEILGQMSSFTFAGMDTTSSALSRILHLLCDHQDVQDKLREEIRQARKEHGDQIPYDQLVALPYMDAVCRETMRIFAPISMVSRTTRQDVVLPLGTPIKGLDGREITEIPIPSNTNVIVGILAANRNPEVWGPDADKWKPERWLNPLPETVPSAHMPGIYSHLGFKFSQLEMKVVLALLVGSFRFRPSKKEIFWQMTVDDLAFIGHPVCAEGEQGGGVSWKFKPEKIQTGARGRDESEMGISTSPRQHDTPSPSMPPFQTISTRSEWLQTFHLALVLDLPDPSSSASGNLSKYFNIIYEQIAFTLTAVLYQEQVLSNFVEKECDTLLALKETCDSYSTFTAQALEVSSIAPAMKTIYESLKASDIAYVTINYLPLQLQLPPYIDSLLHSQNDNDTDLINKLDDDLNMSWGEGMSVGWKLPTMAPWKTVLLLDIDGDMDPSISFQGPQISEDDQKLAEGLMRFLETASVTLSLYEMAQALEWDLENQVYPIVRWLILHRRAKIVDVVHPELKTVFALPPKFHEPMYDLAAKFRDAFPHPAIQPLIPILAAISTATSKPSGNHFYASVVKVKEHIPMYHDVVLWMLKRDMLVTLHLRIRIVATRDLKLRVKANRENAKAHRARYGPPRPAVFSRRDTLKGSSNPSFFHNAKPALVLGGRLPSAESIRSEISELDFNFGEGADLQVQSEESDISEPDDSNSGWDEEENHTTSTMIDEPGKATPMQRRWLTAMSDGKDPHLAKRFEQINQYFDGKRSDDEILYRADISRKQLREILHHYEDYLETFMHRS
ncbi:hypothetical protein D9619_004812 [Psilocybe cf. subviscida]|uniref:Nitrogen permease regulator 3 n=1 Tax=Psilocybe cf. subviscida TaxID=2480587 RepID=A0A8H5F7W3_9AGAR|nr:hypothetical protein D9619_004812 [Psilocybe cf. subviscida]